ALPVQPALQYDLLAGVRRELRGQDPFHPVAPPFAIAWGVRAGRRSRGATALRRPRTASLSARHVSQAAGSGGVTLRRRRSRSRVAQRGTDHHVWRRSGLAPPWPKRTDTRSRSEIC